MSIEFIRDEFLENKKEELDNINEVLTHKHKKPDRKVLFLRRFTLALLRQYKVKIKRKNDEIDLLNRHITHETKKIHEFRRPIQRIMPQPPLHIPTPHGLNVPMPKQELEVPRPISVENKKEEVPTPL